MRFQLYQLDKVSHIAQALNFSGPKPDAEPHLSGHNQRDICLAIPGLNIARRGLRLISVSASGSLISSARLE
jgi:hypothetical protein